MLEVTPSGRGVQQDTGSAKKLHAILQLLGTGLYDISGIKNENEAEYWLQVHLCPNSDTLHVSTQGERDSSGVIKDPEMGQVTLTNLGGPCVTLMILLR